MSEPTTDDVADSSQSQPADAVAEALEHMRAQLPAHEADELSFIASDDPNMFCAIALSKAQRGSLVLPHEIRAALQGGMSRPR